MNCMEKPANYPSITTLICTLNEEDSLPQVLPKVPGWVDEVLIVDGHSTDNTIKVARDLCPRAKIILQTGRGKGGALKTGIKEAGGDIIVTLDADGATDPAEIDKFITPLLNGYDFAKGTRFLRGMPPRPLHRILGNWIITLMFDVLFGCRYTDLCSGYSAFWRGKLEGLDLLSDDDFENEPLINARVKKYGLKVIEVGHSDRDRIAGEVKETSWRQGFKAIKGIIRERLSA